MSDPKVDEIQHKILHDGIGKLFGNTEPPQKRIMIGIPMLGLVRAEWMFARYGQIIPCNWSATDVIRWIDTWAPFNYLVADARNAIVDVFIREGFEWLFFIDSDVVLPPGLLLKLNDRMMEGKIPVWSGLYFTKSVPSEPLVYRGRGNGYFKDWIIGDQIWVDGIPMGCTLIHRSILKLMWEESPEYVYKGFTIRKVFETPARVFFDVETGGWFNFSGTEDLEWCTKVIKGKYFERAGWKEYQDKQYPFLLDTSLFCKHIDPNGVQYPSKGEEYTFLEKKKEETVEHS